MRKLHIFIISLFITIPCIADDCLKDTAPEYFAWYTWGKPDCWCCKRQCRGDANCDSFINKVISLTDLEILKAAFNKSDAELALVPNGICADFNHASFFGKRVTITDLGIFSQYFLKPPEQVPCCDLDGDCILTEQDKYNFWTD